MQSDVVVSGTAISGTLKYVDGYTGFSSDESLQSGNFLAVKFSDIDENATSLKVGIQPSSIGADLVEAIDDPDGNAVFRVTDKDAQKVVVKISDGTHTKTQTYSLTGLTLEESDAEEDTVG